MHELRAQKYPHSRTSVRKNRADALPDPGTRGYATREGLAWWVGKPLGPQAREYHTHAELPRPTSSLSGCPKGMVASTAPTFATTDKVENVRAEQSSCRQTPAPIRIVGRVGGRRKLPHTTRATTRLNAHNPAAAAGAPSTIPPPPPRRTSLAHFLLDFRVCSNTIFS